MKERIRENINNPEILEQMYREERKKFISGFEEVYPEIEKSEIAKYWKIRLDFDKKPDRAIKTDLTDIIVMISACLMAGFLIKIPDIFSLNISDSLFYEKNAGIIVFFGISIYMIWCNKTLGQKKLLLTLLLFLIPAIYINLLPADKSNDSVTLACIHLPLLMWCVFGLVFLDFDLTDKTKRIDFIKYNGELAIIAALIVIAGGILTGITIGLFGAIGINIEKFYMKNVVIIGAASAAIVAAFILKNYTTMTNKIAPVIAELFSPLVLITAIVYLIALVIAGKDPYSDREFLLMFNIMLLGVMAVIVFSISETSVNRKQKFNEIILFSLSVITVIIDLIALTAIFYRLGAYGITPNRLAVLGSNILIAGNLVLIIIDLYKINFKKSNIGEVELTISRYLPVYAVWILFVVFGFPLIFGMI
jgi:hypothetical protein